MNTNHMRQKWAGPLDISLAFVLIAGCQSAGENASEIPDFSVETGQAQSLVLVPHPITPESAPPTVVTPPVRVNFWVADKMADSEGNVWLPDEGYADGNPCQMDDVPIANTTDQGVNFRTISSLV